MAECPSCERDDFKSRRGMKYHHSVSHGESLGSEHSTVPLTCEYCGTEYDKREDRADESKFCSAECRVKGRSTDWAEREDRNCETCDDVFTCHPNDDQRFCSTDCFHEWRTDYMSGDDSPLSKKVEVTCSECGESFKRAPSLVAESEEQYCSRECYHQNYTGENAPRWKGGAEEYYGETWTRQRRKALERDDYECQDCGLTRDEHYDEWDRDLEVHHIQPFRTFDDSTNANELSNLITLCKQCHTQREAG